MGKKVTSLLPIERGNQFYVLAGDSEGGINVFHKNGTLKGRTQVAEEDEAYLRIETTMYTFFRLGLYVR